MKKKLSILLAVLAFSVFAHAEDQAAPVVEPGQEADQPASQAEIDGCRKTGFDLGYSLGRFGYRAKQHAANREKLKANARFCTTVGFAELFDAFNAGMDEGYEKGQKDAKAN